MTSTNLITFTAFLCALTQLDDKLPAEIQEKLNQIGENFDPNHTNKLDRLAEDYPPLDTIYQKQRFLLNQANERRKLLPSEPTGETSPIVVKAIPVFTSDNSVATVKENANINNINQLLSECFKTDIQTMIPGEYVNGKTLNDSQDSDRDILAALDRWFAQVDRLEPTDPQAESNEYEEAIIKKYKKQGLIL
jgi:hypothetical protein